LQEIKAQGKGNYFLKHQDESNSERESIKPIRNIFKMSRVLVNTNLKESKKKIRKSGLDKQNEASTDEKEQDKEHEDTSENEYEYSLSSQSSDEDLSDEGEGLGKKKKFA